MDSPCIKQTLCKVLKIFQYGKYLVAYVLKSGGLGQLYFLKYYYLFFKILLAFWPILYATFFASKQKYC